MKKIITVLGGIIAVALFAFAGAVLVSGSRPAQADEQTSAALPTFATTTASIAVTTSQVILATSTNPKGIPGVTSFVRVYATICNANSNPVYISLNGGRAASATSATYVIAAAAGYSACYEITDRNAYQGAITASSTNQTSTSVTVADYVR